MLAEMNCDVGSEQMKLNARIDPSILSTFLFCFLPFFHASSLILYSPKEYPILDTKVGLEDTDN